MNVLAIDTSHEFGSLAMLTRDGDMEQLSLHEPGGFSGILFSEIGSLLSRHQMRSEDIDLFAAAAGPGSFTGIRIGLTAAKAMAEAHGKPCFGISNLAAMAQSGSAATRAVLLDARRGEVYGGVFGGNSADEVVAPFQDWAASLPDVEEFLAFDFTPFEQALAQSRFVNVIRTRVPREIAGAIAELAVRRHQAGDSGDAALVDANYVRRSDAELLWKDRL